MGLFPGLSRQAVYIKSLKLTSLAKQASTVGEVVNIMVRFGNARRRHSVTDLNEYELKRLTVNHFLNNKGGRRAKVHGDNRDAESPLVGAAHGFHRHVYAVGRVGP